MDPYVSFRDLIRDFSRNRQRAILETFPIVIIRPKAGTAVFMHANVWHRAMPTTPQGTKRRLLLFGYYPTWLKRGLYGVQPENGLTKALIENADQETLEILGRTGYM
jgi:hypothetical protein